MARTIVNRRNLANFGGNIQPAATPIDTYYRPVKQTPPENEAVAGIINALKMVNPALEKYGDRISKVASDTEFAAGQKEYDLMSSDDRKKALADIKSGKMSEVESPFWVRGFAKNLLASEAYKFGESLAIDYEKQKNQVTADGNSLFNWMASKKADFIKANGLEGFAPDVLESHFMTPVRQFEQNTLQKHTAFRVGQIKDENKMNFMKGLTAVHNSYLTSISGITDPLQRDTVTGEYLKGVNSKIQTYITEGNDPKEVLDAAEQMFKAEIEDEYDDGNTQLAEHIYRKGLLELRGKEGKFGDYKRDKLEDWWEGVQKEALEDQSKKLLAESRLRKEEGRIAAAKIKKYVTDNPTVNFNLSTFATDKSIPQDVKDAYNYWTVNSTELGDTTYKHLRNFITNPNDIINDEDTTKRLNILIYRDYDFKQAREELETANENSLIDPIVYANYREAIDKGEEGIFDSIDPSKNLGKLIKDFSKAENYSHLNETYNSEMFQYGEKIRKDATLEAQSLMRKVVNKEISKEDAAIEFNRKINEFRKNHTAKIAEVEQRSILLEKKDYFWENPDLQQNQKATYSKMVNPVDTYLRVKDEKLLLEEQGQQNTHKYSNVIYRLEMVSNGIRNTDFYKMMVANRKDKNNTIQVLNQNLTGDEPQQVPLLPIDDLPIDEVIRTYDQFKLIR